MEVSDLYDLPLDRFVPERNALAREARRDGRREEAKTITALRKPSVGARAVNQLVRAEPKTLGRLFKAGDVLSEVQSKVLAGDADGRALSKAAEREREAVSALVDKVRPLLQSEGHDAGPALLEKVAETLHAAALDADVRETVRAGRLERELRHVGLGLTGADAAPPRGRPAGTGSGGTPKAGDMPVERRRAEALKQARAEAKQTARDVERASKALAGAVNRRERAATALQQADQAVAQARAEAQSATESHRQAQQKLDAL